MRQAIRKAIDVPAIIAAAYNGAVEPAYALEAPGILGYWKDAPKNERDVEGAKKLLEEAGQGGGFSTRLTVLNKAVAQATAAVVQANLAEIGIDVQIDALDEGAYWAYGENDASKDLELVLVEYRGKFDPGFQTQWFTADQIGTWNWQRWNSKEFDELHRQGGIETDAKKREQIYIDAQKLMDDSAAFWWITHNAYTFAFKDTLVAGHPAQRQPVAVRLVQAGLNEAAATDETGERPARCRALCRVAMPGRDASMSKTASEGSLARYAAIRLATAVLVLIGSMALLCSLTLIVPGDPATILLGPRATPEAVAMFREQMGLDLPLYERVFVFFCNALQGDLGVDVINGRPVAGMVMAALPNTLLLAVSAIGLAVAIGIPIGCYAAVRPGSLLDQALAVVSVGLVATPSYVVAILLLYFFSVRLGWFPVLGAGDAGNPLDQLHHLVLPTVALARRLDRLHRAAGALLAARGAGRAVTSAPRAPTASRNAASS